MDGRWVCDASDPVGEVDRARKGAGRGEAPS